MIPGHEALIFTAFSTIALLSIVTFAMVARYRKSLSEGKNAGSPEKA